MSLGAVAEAVFPPGWQPAMRLLRAPGVRPHEVPRRGDRSGPCLNLERYASQCETEFVSTMNKPRKKGCSRAAR